MANLQAEDDFIKNDVKKQVAADGAGSVRWFETTSANIFPGMPVKIVAGTSTGVVETAASDSSSNGAFGVVELDKTQIDDCDAVYANGDLVPILPFAENAGLRCRNLYVNDPNAAIEKNAVLGAGISGFLVPSTEVSGSYGASGLYVRTYKYRADPTANYRSIGDII